MIGAVMSADLNNSSLAPHGAVIFARIVASAGHRHDEHRDASDDGAEGAGVHDYAS
jgi:hypothetical protein